MVKHGSKNPGASARAKAYWARRHTWNRRTTEETRWDIADKFRQGLAMRKIGRDLDVTHKTVRKWVTVYNKTGTKAFLKNGKEFICH